MERLNIPLINHMKITPKKGDKIRVTAYWTTPDGWEGRNVKTSFDREILTDHDIIFLAVLERMVNYYRELMTKERFILMVRNYLPIFLDPPYWEWFEDLTDDFLLSMKDHEFVDMRMEIIE